MLGMIVANIEFMMICIYLFAHALFSHCLFTSLLDMFSLRKSVSSCLSVSSSQNRALNLLDLPRSHVFIPFQSSSCDCLEIAFLNFAMIPLCTGARMLDCRFRLMHTAKV